MVRLAGPPRHAHTRHPPRSHMPTLLLLTPHAIAPASKPVPPQFATPKALFGAAASLTRGAADLGREATGTAVAQAKKTISSALETATLEYDEAGNALVTMEAEGADDSAPERPTESQEHGGGSTAGVPASPLVRAHNPSVHRWQGATPTQPSCPATPGSVLSEPDVSAQLARLLEEREELRGRVEEQKAQIDQRLAEHLQTASQREEQFAQQLRVAADRKQARVPPLQPRASFCLPTLRCVRGAGVGAACAAGRGAHAGCTRGRAARRGRAAAAPRRAHNLPGGLRSRRGAHAPVAPSL